MNVSARSKHMKVLSGEWLSAIVEVPSLRWLLLKLLLLLKSLDPLSADHSTSVLYLLQQVGDDKTIKQWKMEVPGYGEEEEPLNTILGKVWLSDGRPL